MAAYNDEPTLRDTLARLELVREVGDEIATCKPPHVFGVHGGWGLGKTSFLQQVQYYLTGECQQQSRLEIDLAVRANLAPRTERNHITLVWFEAWRYQHEQAPVVALLQEMRSQLSMSKKVWARLKGAGEVALRGALLSMDEFTKKVGIQAAKFEQAGKDWEQDNLAMTLPSHTARQLLTEIIGKLLPKRSAHGTPRVVVMIDDLDRCEPQAIYRLLEGLKLYLSLDNCVFVLGMNQQQVVSSIAAMQPRDGNRAHMRTMAEDYMEKLCQNVWKLPTVRDPLDYLCALIDDEPLRHRVWSVLDGQNCLPPNPRRLKGLANVVRRLGRIEPPRTDDAAIDDEAYQTALMLIVAFIYQFHHDLYVRWEHQPAMYREIELWARSGRTLKPGFEGLQLPNAPDRGGEEDDDSATPSELPNQYPDPSRGNIFWIQPLIQELGDDADPAHFLPYLRYDGS